jgi:hypothetical protein
MIRLLPVLILVFKVWLVIDAIRRREACYWPWIIFFVPLGGVVYFFLVKIDDYNLARIGDLFRRPPSVADLRYHYQQTPSLANRTALAQALYREGSYQEAAEHYSEALRQQPQDPEVLYGFGLTRIAQQDYREAVVHLNSLVELDKTYRQYGAWPPLAHALFESGSQEECLTALKRLVEENPRIQHKMLLAQYLDKAGSSVEARDVLSDALAEHYRSPRFLKRRNFRPAMQAKSMLRALDKPA